VKNPCKYVGEIDPRFPLQKTQTAAYEPETFFKKCTNGSVGNLLVLAFVVIAVFNSKN